jgi:pre-mRNA-splicing factor RBM22/SLT11
MHLYEFALTKPDLFFRHEKPVESALSHQNIPDRYHGRNDPVAHKILSTHADAQGLAPPADQAIVRLIIQ